MVSTERSICDVSVVIPLYNRRDVIGRALESVLCQTTPPKQIIVVDDCSADDGAAVAASLLRDVDCVIRLEENVGGAGARNVGIQKATASLVAFLDSDDQWYPDKLERQLAVVERLRGSNRWIIYSNIDVIYDDGSISAGNIRLFQRPEHISEYLLVDYQVIQTSTWLMPRILADEIKFDEKLRKHQDWDFILRAGSAGVEFIGTMDSMVRYFNPADNNRISRTKNINISKAWIEQKRSLITKRAMAAFSISMLFPDTLTRHPIVAFRYMLDALRYNVPAKKIAKAIMVALLPSRGVSAIRRFF
jgi:glycosyltransferase involved in cell wall biosynthesis